MPRSEPGLDAVFHYINQLMRMGYWGKFTISFEQGEIVHLKKEETLKLKELKGRDCRSN